MIPFIPGFIFLIGPIAVGVIIVVVVVILIIVGQGAASGSGGSGSSGAPCAQCKLDKEWYKNLNFAQQVIYAVWYAARMAACALKGC